MKNTVIPKAMRQQAALRKTKPPVVMAQQAALNTVMLGRKGGVHRTELSRKERLAQVAIKEAR